MQFVIPLDIETWELWKKVGGMHMERRAAGVANGGQVTLCRAADQRRAALPACR